MKPQVRVTDWYIEWCDKAGFRSRRDAPAYIFENGYQAWFLNGCYHRTDGPAVLREPALRLFYLQGKEVLLEADYWKAVKDLQ